MKVVIRKRKKTYQLEDLSQTDLKLLEKAYSMPDSQFMCFGKSYFRLEALGLISDECQITHYGKTYLWELTQQETVFKRKSE